VPQRSKTGRRPCAAARIGSARVRKKVRLISEAASGIRAGNKVIGGVGVSGAPGGEKDEACANAGLAKVADALK